MNHPTHPEEQVFAGLVMGREAVTVEPSTLTDAVIIEIATALGINMRTGGGAIKLARAVIKAQAALAAPVAAQKISAWLHTGELGKCWATIGPSGSGNPKALYLHSAAAQPVQPAVPVTDAEVRLMFSDRYNKPTPDEFALMREALEFFLASRGQA